MLIGASDADLVDADSRAATWAARPAGAAGAPSVADVLTGRNNPENPYFSPPAAGASAGPAGQSGP
jgi:hypothetical protein